MISFKRSILSTMALAIFSFNLFSQKIAVIEKNIFSSLFIAENTNSSDYKLHIRELFEKKGSNWIAIDNSIDTNSAKTFKSKVKYLLEDGKHKSIVTGIRVKNNSDAWLAHELFKVENPNIIRLNKLPASILKGFEHQDILANKIVTDKSVKRKNITLFKTEFLSENLMNKIFNVLWEKHISYYQTDDTNHINAVKRNGIDKKIRLMPNGLKLGKVNIVSGNTCFAEPGHNYGGGILHYIIYPNQEIKLLVTNTELIDVADYDNDGKLEYIFFKSWFNNYGYIMYYDNFEKQVVKDWSYH